MAEAKTSVHDFNWVIQGNLTVTGDTTIASGSATLDGRLASTGTLAVSAFRLTQTLGGTDVVNTWSTAGSPPLSTGMSYLTFSAGASEFRIACWPTT